MTEMTNHYKKHSEASNVTLTSCNDEKPSQQHNNRKHNSNNKINNNNPKSPSSKACVPCFFFANKKSSKKKKNLNTNKTKNTDGKINNHNILPFKLPEIRVEDDRPQSNCNNSNISSAAQAHPQVSEASTGFLYKLSPIRRKESKTHQQQQTTTRRSRLTLNMNNYYLRPNIYPKIEYVNCNNNDDDDNNNNNSNNDDDDDDSNITTLTTATGEIVCASTPKVERQEAKTGRVVEKLWIQQAPPVIEGKGFDPTAEAKLFEANEGVFVVDPASSKRYRKGRFLGKGGFANCFEFTDTSTNAVYAGKIVNKSHFLKQKQKEKMMLEIKLHRKLSHENVVAFHDYFEDEDNLYLILELCSRKSLDELLKRRGPLTEPEVRYYMRQVVEGCRYIHSKRIIHRDLKLGNLLLNGSMQIKIADFGLATQVSSQDLRKKSICGTPNYVAPEVIRRSFYSYEVDVWSIGCIMYTLLCGVTPFETNNLRATYDRISTATYTLPSYLSPPARDLIVRLLDLDPNNRLGLDQVLYEEFFTTGFAPVHLSPSTCIRRPTFPKSNYLSRAQSMNTTSKMRQQLMNKHQQQQHQQQQQQHQQQQQLAQRNQFMRKVLTTNVITRSSPVDLYAIPECKKEPAKSPPPSKENMLNRARKMTSSIDLYKILGRCMSSIQNDTAVALDLLDSSILYVTRWVDFSNKYGFAFQLSDDCTGVLFNDTTRMILKEDSVTLKYVDWSNSASSWRLPATDEMPEDCRSKLSVLLYVRNYMHKRLKPTRFDSSLSTISSSTNSTAPPTPPLIPSSSSYASYSSKRRSILASPEESLISSTDDSTAEGDSQGFAASAESTSNASEAIFTIGSSYSSPERRYKKSSSSSSEGSFKRHKRSNNRNSRGKENIETTNTSSAPRPAKRTTSLRQQQQQQLQTASKLTAQPTKQKRLKKRHLATDRTPTDKNFTVDSNAPNGVGPGSGSTHPSPSNAKSSSSSSTLADTSGTISEATSGTSEAVFMTKWFREEDGIIMQLSNGTYQVNFSDDHSKLILSLVKGEYVVTHLPINNKSETIQTTPTKCKEMRTGSIKDVKCREKIELISLTDNGAKPVHYSLIDICDKGCNPPLAEKLKVVRRKLYKLVNFEGQSV